MSQDVARMSRECRENVARMSHDVATMSWDVASVAEMSQDVAEMSRRCRGDVARCRKMSRDVTGCQHSVTLRSTRRHVDISLPGWGVSVCGLRDCHHVLLPLGASLPASLALVAHINTPPLHERGLPDPPHKPRARPTVGHGGAKG